MLLRCAVLLALAPAALALTLPSDMTVEATQPGGAVVTYATSTNGIGDDFNGRPIGQVSCAPMSGSLFTLGTTTVQCHDNAGSTGSFDVTITDTTAPLLTTPYLVTVQASQDSGAAVTYSASARDIVDGNVGVACAPASGSLFAVGDTLVSCSAHDSHGNHATAQFLVRVLAPQPPPPPPPSDITKEATGPSGAVVTFNASGGGSGPDIGFGDDPNGRPVGDGANCAPASGSTFPLGVTTVQCGSVSFKVTIVDTTAPALALPDNIVTQNPIVHYTATASDVVDGNVAVACTPASGSTFATGTTSVQCTASDSRGNSASGSFFVTVNEAPPPPPADTEAPVIVAINATPNVLAPPNKKLVEVTLTVEVTDDTDPAPLVRIFDVTADETLAADDANITGLLTVELRADRAGNGDGRVYTIWVEAIDDAGNRGVSSVNVTVPHDSSSADGQPPAPTTPTKRRAVRGRG